MLDMSNSPHRKLRALTLQFCITLQRRHEQNLGCEISLPAPLVLARTYTHTHTHTYSLVTDDGMKLTALAVTESMSMLKISLCRVHMNKSSSGRVR